MASRDSRDAYFDRAFREDLAWWIKTKPALALRILDLVEAAIKDPFHGIGKPEPLRAQLSGAWSRRIDQEHRLVYLVTKERISFLQARYHY